MAIYSNRILVDWAASGEEAFAGLAPFFVFGFIARGMPVCLVPILLYLLEKQCQL